MKYFNKINNAKIYNYKSYYFDFDFYKFNKTKKSIFIKTSNNKLKNYKNKSFVRDKNLTILKKYFNNSICDGKKEFFFVNFNNFLNLFYFIFFKENEFYLKYESYKNIFELIRFKEAHLNFNSLLNVFIHDFNSVFDIKVCKIPKKYKLKFKKKFSFELIYIYRVKRLKFTLKLLNNLVKKNKSFGISYKFFWTFIDVLLNPQKTFLTERKNYIYKRALKKFFKKQ